MGKINTTGVPGVRINKGVYLIDKEYKGQRITRRVGSIENTSLEDVKTILTKEMYLIDNPETNRKFTDGSKLSVLDALEYLWEERLKYKKYANAITCYLKQVSARLGNKLVKDLKKIDFERYIRERLNDTSKNKGQNRTISRRTVQIEVKYLSAAINLLVDDGVLERNHISKFIKIKLDKPKQVIFDDGKEYGPQYRGLIEAMSPKVREMVEVLYETGMRPVDLFNMRWGWLMPKEHGCWIIRIPAEECVDGVRVYEEKTRNQHDIPVSPRALEVFKAVGMSTASKKLVFPSNVTGKVRKDIRTGFNSALEAAGLTGLDITPYALRRTRITIWDEIDPTACRVAAGHAINEVHVKHYVNITPSRLFKLVGIEYGTPTKQNHSNKTA